MTPGGNSSHGYASTLPLILSDPQQQPLRGAGLVIVKRRGSGNMGGVNYNLPVALFSLQVLGVCVCVCVDVCVCLLRSSHLKGGYDMMLCEVLFQFNRSRRNLQMRSTFGLFVVCIVSALCALQYPKMFLRQNLLTKHSSLLATGLLNLSSQISHHTNFNLRVFYLFNYPIPYMLNQNNNNQ